MPNIVIKQKVTFTKTSGMNKKNTKSLQYHLFPFSSRLRRGRDAPLAVPRLGHAAHRDVRREAGDGALAVRDPGPNRTD